MKRVIVAFIILLTSWTSAWSRDDQWTTNIISQPGFSIRYTGIYTGTSSGVACDGQPVSISYWVETYAGIAYRYNSTEGEYINLYMDEFNVATGGLQSQAYTVYGIDSFSVTATGTAH